MLPYTPYSSFLSRHFVGKVQKIPLDLGLSCPVRDGSISRGGCAYCNRSSFVPRFSSADATTVAQRLEEGKRFFARRNKGADVTYVAYFQNGTNTHGTVGEILPRFREALEVADVKGVVVATRPDCLGEEWLDALSRLAEETFVLVELGVESVFDHVLKRVGRGHDAEAAKSSIERLKSRDIPVCAHLIFGLPGEPSDVCARTAKVMNERRVDVVKLHQLQILKGSVFAAEFAENPEQFPILTPETYAEGVVSFLEHLSPEIAVERFVSQAPPGQVIAPVWGLKNDAFLHRLVALMNERKTGQGIACP
ncbi:MAG: TIGR01212 family radical SAM protein [Alloprevotella sp.]